MTDTEHREPQRTVPPRWLTGLWLAASALIVLLRVVIDTGDAGLTNVVTALLAILAAVAGLVWFVFLSDHPARLRLGLLALVVGVLVLGGSLFELRGWTGEMVPIFGLRLHSETTAAALGQGGRVDLTRTTVYDYPGFLGPDRNLRVDDIRLLRDWQKRGPELLWRQPIGAGWGAFAVVDGFAATLEQRGGSELVTLYSVDTGRLLWTYRLGPGFSHLLGGLGPRSTPTIDSGLVYALGVHGKLVALDGATGTLVWDRDLLADHGVTAQEEAADVGYGRPTSPLVIGDKLIIGVGGSRRKRVSVAAYDKRSGALIWEGGEHNIGMASPGFGHLAGRDQVLMVNENWVSGHDLDSGEQLWEFEWPGITSADASVSQAVPVPPNRVFVSKGYGGGAAMYAIETSNGTYHARQLWHRSRVLRTKLTNVAIKDGFAYGLSEGILECVDLATGERAWKAGRYHHGQILMVGAVLLVLTEDGELVMVEASPTRKDHEFGRFHAIDGHTWNNLALYGDVLLVRNGQEAAAFRLPLDNQVIRGSE